MKTMTSVWSALTPALSPRRGSASQCLFIFAAPSPRSQRSCDQTSTEHSKPARWDQPLQRRLLSPSPGGEGRGEGGQSSLIRKFTVGSLRTGARAFFIAIVSLVAAIIPARAELPEPDNIVYGVITRNGLPVHATDTDVIIEARRNSDGAVVASYRMGDSARSGDNFTLRVPLEVFTPVFDSQSSLTGTAMTIVASDFNGTFAEALFTMGGRGQFHQLNISHFLGFDSDGDGLLDEWEMFWFGSLIQGGNTDTDGDGSSNTAEYLAGTNPNDFNSRFRLNIVRVGANAKEVSFVAQAAAGAGYQSKTRSYTLESTQDLSNPNWQPVAGYVNVLGAGQTVRYAVPEPSGFTRFYRVSIQLSEVGPPLPQ